MTQSKYFTFAITDDLKRGLQIVKEREGISEAEQIRRGLQMWLESKGVTKADATRAKARKKTESRPE